MIPPGVDHSDLRGRGVGKRVIVALTAILDDHPGHRALGRPGADVLRKDDDIGVVLIVRLVDEVQLDIHCTPPFAWIAVRRAGRAGTISGLEGIGSRLPRGQAAGRPLPPSPPAFYVSTDAR